MSCSIDSEYSNIHNDKINNLDNDYQEEIDIYRNKFIAFLSEGTESDNMIFINFRINIKNQEEFKIFLSSNKKIPLDFWSCPFGFKIFEQLYPYNKKN